ncbi:bacteriocin class II family protein [Tyzzerella sp. An114]|uniref:bacteriocin class II family protein n=1 Tax=Tyzzerella sp. An114 TaxID=1965545 RepID=UPI0013022FA3|nr:bacteriocin class II family protein [Tyzzerella sp. An114]
MKERILNMSKELTGKNGKIVGTDVYFQAMNQQFKIEEVVKVSKEYKYLDGLKELVQCCNEMISMIYQDVKSSAYILAFIPEKDRKETAELVKAMGEIIQKWGSHNVNVDRIVSYVLLSSKESKRKSSESFGNIEKAEKKIRSNTGNNISISEKLNMLQKALNSNVSKAASNDLKKFAFLSSVEQGKGNAFLADVYYYYQYKWNEKIYKGKNGKRLCSKEYNMEIVKKIFRNEFPIKYSYGSAKKYVYEIDKMLKNIYNQIESDIKQGEREHHYIQDKNGKILIYAIEQLQKSGIQCSNLKNNIENLMWFVGGNSQKILQLQKKLNILGMKGSRGKLKEDGVFGEETLCAWNQVSKSLVSGSVPVLTYVDILQSNLTDVTHEVVVKDISNAKLNNSKLKNLSDMNDYSMLFYAKNGKKSRAFMLDRPHYEKGKELSFHINYDADKPIFLKKYLNHKEISESTYIRFKNFTKAGKAVRIGGKVLLVAGVLLDTLELGNTIIDDLSDVDKKIGKKTGMTAAKIGSRWAGAAIGAKLGAMAGSGIGTAVAPGFGTAIGGTVLSLVGGIAGAVGGEEFANWVFDITDLV